MSLPPLRALLPQLSDESACVDFLLSREVFYTARTCQACSTPMKLHKDRGTFVCPKRDCRREISLKKGSFFSGHRLPCGDILLLAYFWLCKVSNTTAVTMSGNSRTAVAGFYSYFRELVSGSLDEEDTQIGGPGIIVEVDESKFGKRKYHRGHRVEGVWVLGGVEKTAQRKAFVVSVEDRTGRTLLDILSRHVLPGSIICTDGWAGYRDIPNTLGMEHRVVNHSEHFTDPETGVHTNTIEGTWNGIKMRIAARNRTRQGIDMHLLEFIWRRKHVGNTWEAFISALADTAYDE